MRQHFNRETALLLLLPGVLLLSRRSWEASMTFHMAVQIPLLVLLGILLGRYLQQRGVTTTFQSIHRYRATLLLLALFILGSWMVPRLLDAALHQPAIAFAKWISLPLAGTALILCWHQLPVVLRGILHLEAIATLVRLGWLYLQAPQRYCVSYDLGDQQTLGYVLIIYSGFYGSLLALKVMFGQWRFPFTVSRLR